MFSARQVLGSMVGLTEVLVRPLRNGHDQLAERYRSILGHSDNLIMHPVTAQVVEQAAILRARHNLATPDALIASTALLANCTHLLTTMVSIEASPVSTFSSFASTRHEKGQQ